MRGFYEHSPDHVPVAGKTLVGGDVVDLAAERTKRAVDAGRLTVNGRLRARMSYTVTLHPKLAREMAQFLVRTYPRADATSLIGEFIAVVRYQTGTLDDA